MKKIFVACFLLFISVLAFAQYPPYGMYIQQADVSGTFYWGRFWTPATPTDNYLLAYDGSTKQPTLVALSGNVGFSGGVMSANISSSDIVNALGFAPYSSANPGGYITSAALSSYATTAALTSGLATKLNTPTGTTSQYVRGDGSLATLPSPGTGTVTSITAGTGLSGGTITTSGTISLPNTGTAGTYSTVITDAQGRITSGTYRSVTNVTKTLNTCFQVSASRDADVLYNAQIVSSATLVGGQQGTLYLETFTDSSCTLNTNEIMRSTNGNTNGLAVAIGNVSTTTLTVQGPITAGLYAKLRTENNTGTPTFTATRGWEKLN